MPRFVLLAHDRPHPHLDLLLERDGVLKAWRLPAEFTPTRPAEAEAIADHRLLYLDYEGPVCGDRGRVVRRDAGELDWLHADPDRMLVRVGGAEVNGVFELVRVAGERWRFGPANGPPGSPPPPS
jgi:hypothetical protein